MRFGIENIYLRHPCTETHRTQAHNDKALCNPVMIICTAQIVAAVMFLHINTMSSPWSASTPSAATEHGTGRVCKHVLFVCVNTSKPYTKFHSIFKKGIFWCNSKLKSPFQTWSKPYTKFHSIFKKGIFWCNSELKSLFQTWSKPYTKFQSIFKKGIFWCNSN